MSISLKAKPQLMQKIEKAFNDTLYKDAIETSSNYNNRLIAERASRLPFIDLQTGVAQNNCTLWMNRWERMPGHNQGQIYSYPSRRWRKIRRSYLLNDVFSNKINLECNVSDKNEVIGASSGNSNDNCAIDYPTELENVDSCEKFDPNKDNSGEPEESLPDISELVDIDDADTEDDDDSTSGTKKKARKKYAKRKKASEYTDAEKPYICDLCGIKYKTRPGLSYHYAHSHANSNGETSSGSSNGYINQSNTSSSGTIGMDDMGEMNTRSLVIIPSHSRPGISNPQSLPSYQGHIGNSIKRESHFREKINPTASSLIDQRSLPINYQLNQQPNFVLSPKYSTTGKSTTTINHDSDEDDEKCKNKEILTANTYCDFCLGNANENRNTGLPEKMISCSDCGRSAHLSCLKFTPNMIKSVGKYPWQCIECKSCSLCGSSDNDEQLLFCDDCDRGYHMFCLNPPLSEPPEGSWNCNLCKEAYHSQK